MQWIVSQIGARQHYGVPRGFHYKGHLRLLYTDAWCRWGSSLLRRMPEKLRAFAGRFHPDIPSNKVTASSVRSAVQMFRSKRQSTITDDYQHHLDFGVSFAGWVNRHLSRETLNPENDFFFGFDTGCLETLELLKNRGVRSVVDQIDPGRVEDEMVREEVDRWPGWQKAPGHIPEAYFDRLSAEWELATIVLVNSEWSKEALIAQGVSREKLLVVPVAFEPSQISIRKVANLDRPLTVLWLGTVNLRKGIPYLVEAARILKDCTVHFVIAGPLSISKKAVASAPPNMRFIGRVTRDEAALWYQQSDVFVLPTVSDGFAITQLEAMSQGLPVITTPNCGEVVTHGIDGVIVPPRDSKALAKSIMILEADRQLLKEMSYRARIKATAFHLPRQAEEIERAMTRILRDEPISASVSADA